MFFSLCLAFAVSFPCLMWSQQTAFDQRRGAGWGGGGGVEIGILSTGRRKKIHLSQDLKETKSSKYSQVIAGKKLLVFESF